jgi:hypothetical protein
MNIERWGHKLILRARSFQLDTIISVVGHLSDTVNRICKYTSNIH